MNYEEFKDLNYEKDARYPFFKKFIFPNGENFYIDPTFYSQLEGFETFHHESYPLIIDALKQAVIKYKKVIFVGDFENYQIDIEDYIILEITDITDPLKIYAEDKSRGSDYGD